MTPNKSHDKWQEEQDVKSTHNTREEVWEEELQNIMEDYLSHAEMRHFAKDPADHMKEMREHWQVLKTFFHQELQKARHDWLRGEIVKLEGEKLGGLARPIFVGANAPERMRIHNRALQTIIDRYQSELDQPNK